MNKESKEEDLREFARKFNIVLICELKGIDKSTIYILTSRELSREERREAESRLSHILEPEKCTMLMVADLHPKHLKQVMEKSKIIYISDKNLSDAILAGVLTTSLDFQYFVNEKMSLIIKKRVEEILS